MDSKIFAKKVERISLDLRRIS